MTGKHRRPRRVTETEDWAAMLERMFIANGDRIRADPAMLAHLRHLETVWKEHVNRGIFEANQQPHQPYSQNELAAILGMTHQGVAKRINLGRAAYAALAERRGAGALVRLADARARRAAELAAAGVEDRTSERRAV